MHDLDAYLKPFNFLVSIDMGDASETSLLQLSVESITFNGPKSFQLVLRTLGKFYSTSHAFFTLALTGKEIKPKKVEVLLYDTKGTPVLTYVLNAVDLKLAFSKFSYDDEKTSHNYTLDGTYRSLSIKYHKTSFDEVSAKDLSYFKDIPVEE